MVRKVTGRVMRLPASLNPESQGDRIFPPCPTKSGRVVGGEHWSDEATRDRASRVTRIRERRLEWNGLGTRRSCASARVCLKKEREIQELKKDAKKLLTTAGLVRDCPLNERQV